MESRSGLAGLGSEVALQRSDKHGGERKTRTQRNVPDKRSGRSGSRFFWIQTGKHQSYGQTRRWEGDGLGGERPRFEDSGSKALGFSRGLVEMLFCSGVPLAPPSLQSSQTVVCGEGGLGWKNQSNSFQNRFLTEPLVRSRKSFFLYG